MDCTQLAPVDGEVVEVRDKYPDNSCLVTALPLKKVTRCATRLTL